MDLLLRRFPKSDEMEDFAILILPDFKNNGIQPVAHPPNGNELFRDIGPAIEPIRSGKQLPSLFEPYTSPWVCPEAVAFSSVKAKTHLI
jgi:hypothetical protein